MMNPSPSGLGPTGKTAFYFCTLWPALPCTVLPGTLFQENPRQSKSFESTRGHGSTVFVSITSRGVHITSKMCGARSLAVVS